MRPEVVAFTGSLLGSVVDVERQQPAFLAVDVHASLALLHLFGQHIQTFVVAVKRQFYETCVVGIGNAQAAAHLEDEGIHQMGRVAVVGEHHPVFLFGKAQNGCLLVELQAVGLFGIPLPRGVASSADASPALVIPFVVVRLYLDVTATIVSLAGHSHIVVYVDGDSCYLIFGICRLGLIFSDSRNLNSIEGK